MLADADLMAVLMRTSAGSAADTAAAFRSADPADPATSQPFGSGALVSWGVGRYVNRAIGASLDDLGDGDLDHLEAFFDARGVAPSIEVCSWAGTELLERLAARRFVPIRFNDLLVTDPAEAPGRSERIEVRPVDDVSAAAWFDAYVAGFSTIPDHDPINRELARILPTVANSTHLLAAIDGHVAGCGSLYRQGSVGWLAGGATRPEFRGRGVQAALICERLASAHRIGCAVAAATAVSGSQSSRNMQRLGFTVAATILIMTRHPG